MEGQNLKQNLLDPCQDNVPVSQPSRSRRFTVSLIPQSYYMKSHYDSLIVHSNRIENNWKSLIEEQQSSSTIMNNFLMIKKNNKDILAKQQLSSQIVLKRSEKRRANFNQQLSFVENETKKELNSRIFKLNRRVQKFLYFFNLLFNSLFRSSILIILILQFLEKKENTIPTSILLGLQGMCVILYSIAMTKILYTKSSDISISFQKEFYEKPYAEIEMDRILRKHFTFHKFRNNFWRYLNPKTNFNRNIKLLVFQQEIYKRMEMVLVGIPLIICYVFNIPWFNLEGDRNEMKIESGIVTSIVLIIELVRMTIHYVVIYIFS